MLSFLFRNFLLTFNPTEDALSREFSFNEISIPMPIIFVLHSGHNLVGREYPEMISFINPRRIIVVGDSSYVPQKYVDIARRCSYPTQEITSSSWENNAKAIGELLNQGGLKRDFLETKKRLASAGFDPGSEK